MKYTAAGLLVVAGLVAGASPASAEFSLSIHGGKVTLVADNVTVRQILTEWARVGQTKVVNIEKLSGPPVTLRLENVPEAQALDILLRSSSGFMVALRPTADPAASMYDRILLMPPSTASASAAVARPPAPVSAAVPPPMAPPVPPPAPQGAGQPADDGDEPDDPAPPSPYANDARPPETNFDYANPQEFLRRRQEMLQQQQQQQQAPAAQPSLFPGSVTPYSQPQQPPAATPSATPGATGGSARPGEIVKPPQGQQPVYNPYGIAVPPGAAAEPDRAKYANPYQNPPKE